MRQRPIAVTVFGILNIGFAILKYAGLLLGIFLGHHKLPGNSSLNTMQSDPTYQMMTHFNFGLSAVFGLILITSGIGLLLLQKWARVLSVVYAGLEIIAVLVGAVIGHRVVMKSITALQFPGAPPGLIELMTQIFFALGVILGLAYPVLLLIFMTRPKIIEAFEAGDGIVTH